MGFMTRTSSQSSSRSSRDLPVGAALLAGLVAAVLGGGLGCYKPSILDGGYSCANNGPCPDGFTCDLGTLTCRRPGGAADAGVDRPATADARMDARPDMAEAACVVPPPLCAPVDAGARCDPKCQSGCGCNQKCSSNSAGTFTCNAPIAPATRMTTQSCDIQSPGTAQQTDNCAPGLVCVADLCQDQRCYQFCTADQDCPNSTCTGDAGNGVKICDVPFVTCVPLPGQQSGCTIGGQSCYAAGGDRTLCACPGQVLANSACTRSRDCLPGLVCVNATVCRRVCNLMGGGNGGCNNGQTCRSLNGSTTYGYCL
jgi:hypothetical protein